MKNKFIATLLLVIPLIVGVIWAKYRHEIINYLKEKYFKKKPVVIIDNIKDERNTN